MYKLTIERERERERKRRRYKSKNTFRILTHVKKEFIKKSIRIAELHGRHLESDYVTLERRASLVIFFFFFLSFVRKISALWNIYFFRVRVYVGCPYSCASLTLHAHIHEYIYTYIYYTYTTHTYTSVSVDRYIHTALLNVFWWSVSSQNVAKRL